MSSRATSKRRIVKIADNTFRILGGAPRYGPGFYAKEGILWASCATKIEKPIMMQVTNAGTTFAQLQVLKPTYTKKFTPSKPCNQKEE